MFAVTEEEATRFLEMHTEDFEAEIGQAVLDDEGVLNSSPHSKRELIEFCQSWWSDHRAETCSKILANDHVRSTIHKGVGLNPASRLVALYSLLQAHNPATAPFQLTFISVMLIRETLKDLCPES